MNRNCIVHGGWLHDDFFIWGETTPNSKYNQMFSFHYPFLLSPFELKLRLFRHDRHSYYGTFIEEKEAIIDVPLQKRQFASLAGEITVYQAEEKREHFSFPIEGIVIPQEELLDYIPIFKQWKADRMIQIAPDLNSWLHLFFYIKEAIQAGSFHPAPSGKWDLIKFPYESWLEAIPEVALAIRENTAYIKDREEPLEQLKKIVTTLTDTFIRNLLHEQPVLTHFDTWLRSVDKIWSPYVKQLKEKREQKITVPESFYEKVGITEQKPFFTCLALREPKTEDGDWILSICMMDRNNRSLIVEMDDLERGEHPWRENPIAQLKIDIDKAKEKIPLLEGLRISSPTITLTTEEAFLLFTEKDERLKTIGIQLIVPKWMIEKKKMKVKLSIEENPYLTSSIEPLLNWQSVASFSYTVAIGNETLNEQQFAKYVEETRPFIFIDGEWIAWDRSLAKQLKQTLEGMRHNASYMETWRLEQLDDERMEVEWSETMLDAMRELYSTSPTLIDLHDDFARTLRKYQHEGVSWLVHLRRVGFGGCLADDMGLGKSIQTIAYMKYVLDKQKMEMKKRPPFLLICPTSLLHNWQEECKKFAPSLRVFIQHGNMRVSEEEADIFSKYDLVITTYQSAIRDDSLLRSVNWNGLILDEAQHIKNVQTKQRRVIKSLKATHRIALTGTPIENRLQELWSLLDVLNPSFLGTYSDFQKQFIIPIEKERDTKKLEALQKLIRPFILRREKSDKTLKLDLPYKSETVHRVHLSVEQAALYQAVVDDIRQNLDSVIELERRALILKSLTKLKQICNHPAHFLKATTVSGHHSGKWEKMLHIIDEIVQAKEKVLIFTQYKEMGHLMVEALERRYRCFIPFLHGSLTRKKRQQAIDQFQHDSSLPIFILSLKAGGVGLNLTAASNVIHYDRWWNPAVENQATDRVYRIGQTKDVHVHKLVTVGTLEERIEKMLAQKETLANDVLSIQPLTELTDDELLQLISLSQGKDEIW